MNKKLEVKDLINVGLFTALYFVVFFATGMLGYIPVLMVLVPFFCPIAAGIPFMLFVSKTKKFGMVSLMGMLLGLLMFAFGHPWPAVVFGIIFGIAADIVLKLANYASLKASIIASAVFSEWLLGSCLAMFFSFKEPYFETIRQGYGDVYADKLYAITPDWMFWFMMLLAFVGGTIGALIGARVLKKHFKKAGII